MLAFLLKHKIAVAVATAVGVYFVARRTGAYGGDGGPREPAGALPIDPNVAAQQNFVTGIPATGQAPPIKGNLQPQDLGYDPLKVGLDPQVYGPQKSANMNAGVISSFGSQLRSDLPSVKITRIDSQSAKTTLARVGVGRYFN